jgi:hypothetical protein
MTDIEADNVYNNKTTQKKTKIKQYERRDGRMSRNEKEKK